MESITLQASDTAVVSGDKLGQLQFAASAESDAGASRLITARILAQAEGSFTSSSNPSSLVFATSSSDSNAAVDRIKIDNNGDILPLVSDQYSLGSSTLKFNELFASTGNFDSVVTNDSVVFASGNTGTVGLMRWNDDDGTVDLGLKGGNVTLQIGQENIVLAFNDHSSQINDGQVVSINGAQGQRISVIPAVASGDYVASHAVGIATENITAGENGFITTYGVVRNLNTYIDGSSEGKEIYVSPTTPGGWTTTRPQPPNHAVRIGYIQREHASAGSIFVSVHAGEHLEYLHDVLLTTPSSGDIIRYDSSDEVWKNSSISSLGVGTVTSIATNNGVTGGTITSTGTIGLTGQALALHNLSTNGLIARTGTGTVAGRTITGTSNQVTVTNGDGVSGNPTLSLPQNIHTSATPTFAGITINGSINSRASSTPSSATQIPVFTADPTSTTRTLATRTPAQLRSDIGAGTGDGTVTSIATNDGITGGTITSTGTIGLTGQALAVHNLSSNGLITRTGAGTIAGRTITGTTNQVTVTNGDGVAGNPTLSLPQNIHTSASPTFAGATLNGSLNIRAAATSSSPTQIPVFTATPASTTRTLVTRTPAQILTDIGAQPLLTKPVTGEGNNGQVAFWSSVNGEITGSNSLFWDSSNDRLGIGLTNPASKLQVNSVSSTIVGIIARGASSQSADLQQWQNNSSQNLLRVLPDGSLSGVASGIFMGSVGVNTASPTQELHVDGSLRVTGAYYDSTNSAGNSGQVLVSTGLGTDWQDIASGGGNVTGTGANGRVSFWTGTNSQSSDSTFFWNNSSKFLGIGTSSPSAKLHINIDSSIKVGAIIQGAAAQAGDIQQWRDSSSNVLARVDGFGNVSGVASGIFNTISIGSTPEYNYDRSLKVHDNGTQFGSRVSLIGTGDTGYPAIEFVTDGNQSKRTLIRHEGEGSNDYGLSFYTTNNGSLAETMRLNGNGNLGVGTGSPAEKLHIASSAAPILRLDRTANFGGTDWAGELIGVIDFYSSDPSSPRTQASIRCVGGDYSGTPNGGIAEGDITISVYDQPNGFRETARFTANGNVGIGTATPAYKLEVNGDFAATTKSFIIDHPTKPGKKLRYASLEGPENGVYFRGSNNDDTIELPDYWHALVDEDTITVNLTPVGCYQQLYVESQTSKAVKVGGTNGGIYYFVVYAERKDVPKLETEVKWD